jgi:rhodanese-related sulfurtransferase
MLKKKQHKTSISAFDFKLWLESKKPPQVLDIRTDEEFEEFNFGGTHIVFDQLLSNISIIDFLMKKPAVIICYTGLQSEIARTILAKKGFSKFLNLEGGIVAFLGL